MPRNRKIENKNRVCFWLPLPWRKRLLQVLDADGRSQGEYIRTAVTDRIEASEKGRGK